MSTTSSVRGSGHRDESAAPTTDRRTDSKTKVDFFYGDYNSWTTRSTNSYSTLSWTELLPIRKDALSRRCISKGRLSTRWDQGPRTSSCIRRTRVESFPTSSDSAMRWKRSTGLATKRRLRSASFRISFNEHQHPSTRPSSRNTPIRPSRTTTLCVSCTTKVSRIT